MAEYRLIAIYKGGLDSKKDERLRKAVGRYVDGGGCCLFGDCERDNDWCYKRRSSAEAALKRIRAAKIRGVRAYIESEQED